MCVYVFSWLLLKQKGSKVNFNNGSNLQDSNKIFPSFQRLKGWYFGWKSICTLEHPPEFGPQGWWTFKNNAALWLRTAMAAGKKTKPNTAPPLQTQVSAACAGFSLQERIWIWICLWEERGWNPALASWYPRPTFKRKTKLYSPVWRCL